MNADKLWDRASELSVIGALIEYPTLYWTITEDRPEQKGLTAEDFYRPEHRQIFQKISEYLAKGYPIEQVSLALAFQGQGECTGLVVEACEKAPPPQSAHYYASVVVAMARKRRLWAALHDGIEALSGRLEEVTNVADSVQSALDGVLSTSEVDGWASCEELLRSRSKGDQPTPPITTGFADLDAKIGGLWPCETQVVAARPSMGKTAFALQLCENAARKEGARCAYFSLEMSKVALINRYVGSRLCISMVDIARGAVRPEQYERIAREFAALPIYIDDKAGLTIEQIARRLRRLKAKIGKIDVVVIDYLQLMGRGKGERDEAIGEISRRARELAKEMGFALVLLSQLNRQCELTVDKRPMLAHLRESGSIEQDADRVLLLHRPEQYFPDDLSLKGKAEVIVAKNRTGEIGTVDMVFKGKQTKFFDVGEIHGRE